MVEKRIDPSDGQLYTFDELKHFYKNTYSKKQVEKYWLKTCRIPENVNAKPVSPSGRSSRRSKHSADEALSPKTAATTASGGPSVCQSVCQAPVAAKSLVEPHAAVVLSAVKDANEDPVTSQHIRNEVQKHVPDKSVGKIPNEVARVGFDVEFTLSEVSKHNSKTDCWVVINGQILDVTNFLAHHPGGELAILTFAGKEASEEFNMIHPPGVIKKYAPDAVIGVVTSGVTAQSMAAASLHTVAPVRIIDRAARDWSRSDRNRRRRMEGEGKIPGYFGALCYMALGFVQEVIFTIFPQRNIVLTNDRSGLTRSAMFLLVFIIIHAIGNLHVFLGPDDFNGYGYFYVRLYWTGFGLQANIIELYILLAAMLHVAVALKRTWQISIHYTVTSGKLNLAMSGITLLIFMVIHLFQFRFGNTHPYALCPPPYLLNLATLFKLRLNLFWVDYAGCPSVYVRDIYRLEFEIFSNLRWVLFYVLSVVVFSTHMCLGWQKVIPAPALEIPKRYHTKATHIGYVMTACIALVYVSFPIYTHLWPMSSSHLTSEPSTP